MVPYQLRIVCQLLISFSAAILIVFNFSSCNFITTHSEKLPYYNSKDLTPTWDGNQQHQISNFNLIDQNGNIFNSDSLNGKIYIANFFFTSCPSICPKMTKCFKILQDSISKIKDVELVSFSVMPWVDSVSRLKKYGIENGINPTKWHLLTGEKSSIYSLGRASFFADNHNLNDTTEFIHTDKMYLIDNIKQIRGVYNGTNKEDIDRALADIKILKGDH